MTKFGTPIGAGPKLATVRPGFVLAGEPSGFRRAGWVIFCFSFLAVCLAPWPFLFCLPNRPGVLARVVEPLELPPPEPLEPLEPPPPEPPLSPGNWSGSGLVGSGLVGGGLIGSGFVGSGTVGTVTLTPPTVIELAVPAPAIANVVPRAMVTRNRFAIRGRFVPRESFSSCSL